MRHAAWIWTLALTGCFSVPALPEGDRPPTECDEGNDRCVEADARVSPDQGSTADGGVKRDAGAADGGALDRGAPDAGEVEDCCRGVSAGPCEALRCVDGQCVASPLQDGNACGLNGTCRDGLCAQTCARPADCAAPEDECLRPTCEDGACGLAPCPGDLCDAQACEPCGRDDECPANRCQRAECIDGYCGAFATTDDDACDDYCDAGRCVQCRAQADCAAFASPLCRDGACVCETDIDCAHMADPECRYADECSLQGEADVGRCEGNQCVARPSPEGCDRDSTGLECDRGQGVCAGGACVRGRETISVSCPDMLNGIIILCDEEQVLQQACGGEDTDVSCARGATVDVCCTSNLATGCGLGAVGPVSLTIRPALEGMSCASGVNDVHQRCDGRLTQGVTVNCTSR